MGHRWNGSSCSGENSPAPSGFRTQKGQEFPLYPGWNKRRCFAGINSWSFALHSLYYVTHLSDVINNKSKAVLFADRTSIIATNSKTLSDSMWAQQWILFVLLCLSPSNNSFPSAQTCVILYREISLQLCGENSNWVKVGQKYQALYMLSRTVTRKDIDGWKNSHHICGQLQ